jgi:nucleoside-diphosphate-sugar epimerase
MKTLLIGGAGPTGPHVLRGLVERGHDVVVLHRGVHEADDLPAVPHIHADPHFASSLGVAVAGLEFDLVLSMYGRTAVAAQVFAGQCGHIVCIGGTPIYRGLLDPGRGDPYGMALNAREDGPLIEPGGGYAAFGEKMARAEQAVFERGAEGAFGCTVVRYPQIYGPRNVLPTEWPVVRRVLDGRTRMVLPDGGLWIVSRCAARNAAALVLSVTDSLDRADGKAFNAADDEQFTVRQWAELVAHAAGGRLEFAGVPAEFSYAVLAGILPPGAEPHMLITADRARAELGYRAVTGAREAIAESVEWLIENPVTPRTHPVFAPSFDYEWEDRLVAAWERFAAGLAAEVPQPQVDIQHPMPHPKAPSLTADERGR